MLIALAERKGDVLSSHGSLPCLRDVPCINITRGCAYECSHCPSHPNRIHADDPHVIVYANLAEKLRQELDRRRHHPTAVYFSPACDPFQPLRQARTVAYECMKVLLEHRVGVAFATVGAIPPAFMSLFAQHAELVQAQIQLTTTARPIQKLIEHGAAPPAARLDNIRRLKGIGVEVGVRIDPLIPALTDIDVNLAKLLADLEPLAPLRAAISYLVVHGHVAHNLRVAFSRSAALPRVMQHYSGGCQIGDDPHATALPMAYRHDKYEHIEAMAKEHGIDTYVCACKNPDLSQQLVCRADRETHFAEAAGQGMLFSV